jgi:hypothetical protein
MYVRTIYNTLASDEQKALPGAVSEKGDLIITQVWLRRVIRKAERMNM